MWNTSKWKKILLFLVAVAAVLLIIGGYTYYIFHHSEKVWLCFCMSLENCLEVLLFNPILPIQTIADDKEFMAFLDGNFEATLIMNAYTITTVLVPFIDILIVFSVVDSFLHLAVGIERKNRRVLIVGYNDNVLKLIRRKNNNCKVYLWTERFLSAEEERELYFNRVSAKMNGFSLGDSLENYNIQKKKFAKFIRRKRITDIFLLDESDAKNLQYYMALSSSEICDEKTYHFYVLAEDLESQNILQEYFDSKLENKKNNSIDTHMDLKILNFDQKQAELLFTKLPIYSGGYAENDKNVHIMIIGGDALCMHIALQAMNQAVLSSNNRIVIDIINNRVDSIRQSMINRFNKDMVAITKDEQSEIRAVNVDGVLRIRFRECDLLGGELIPLLNSLQDEGAGKYTYVALCAKSVKENLSAFRSINSDVLFDNCINVPLAMRMTYSEDMKQYLSGKKKEKYMIYLMGENEEYIGLDHLVDTEEENKIREYNALYNAVTNAKVFGAKDVADRLTSADWDQQWNKLEQYKRDSNRSLYFHQKTKEVMFTGYDDEMKKFWEQHKEEDGSDMSLDLSMRLIKNNPGTQNAAYPALIELAKTEHRRWSYFLISEGWGYAEKKDPPKKKHDCLCDWNTLTEKRPDTLIYDLISTLLLTSTDSDVENSDINKSDL